VNSGRAIPRFEPGDNVRWYAAQFGWKLARRTIFVEGDTDVRYLELAATLYTRATGLRLLGDDLKVLSVGFGALGGTDGIKENLFHLWKLIELDRGQTGSPLYRVIVLLDDDFEGNRTCRYLTDRYIKLRESRDVFVLKRVFPRTSRDPCKLAQIIRDANTSWHDLDCEIEDLLSRELLDVFIEENAGSVRNSAAPANGGYHFDFTAKGKADLCRWVCGVANVKDLTGYVELLKSLRYYLGLKPDGD
jgi:hypothetical protein